MHYLFFDTETTGLPKKKNAPSSDTDCWPRMVQVAWAVCDDGGHLLESHSVVVRPEGYAIPEEVVRIHGITTEAATRDGVPLWDVLARLEAAIESADMLVAHNMDFDANVVGAEFHRVKGYDPLLEKPKYCTMKAHPVVAHCSIPNRWGRPKWPTLRELHEKLFGEGFAGAHDARADNSALTRCFFEIQSLGLA